MIILSFTNRFYVVSGINLRQYVNSSLRTLTKMAKIGTWRIITNLHYATRQDRWMEGTKRHRRTYDKTIYVRCTTRRGIIIGRRHNITSESSTTQTTRKRRLKWRRWYSNDGTSEMPQKHGHKTKKNSRVTKTRKHMYILLWMTAIHSKLKVKPRAALARLFRLASVRQHEANKASETLRP